MRTRPGITISEVLVVIAIIATLLALLIPAIQQAREAARRNACKNNLKQFGVAFHNYHDTHSTFPPAQIYDTSKTNEWWNYAGVGWGALILPYIEQSALYDRINFTVTEPGRDAINHPVRTTNIPIFRCPTDQDIRPIADRAPTNYVFCAGHNAQNMGTIFGGGETGKDNGTSVLYANSKTDYARITDGASNTMVLSECVIGTKYVESELYSRNNINSCGENFPNSKYIHRRGSSWFTLFPDRGPTYAYTAHTVPNALWNTGSCAVALSTFNADAQSMHSGGVQIVLADGSVRFISETIYLPMWQNLANMRDGRVLGEF